MTPFTFFGTGTIAVHVLDELEKSALIPSLIITAPDRAKGRGLALAPSPVASWAAARSIPALKPTKLDHTFLSSLPAVSCQLFLVADYGLIVPKAVLDTPGHGTLNMHPSLLPRLRGPSPIRSAILADERIVGVSIMLLDEKMDHGPLIAQRALPLSQWPPRGSELDALLAREGGSLLAQVIPLWLRGAIAAHPQQHERATYTRKLTKEDGTLDLRGDPYQNLLKIRALEGWPGTHAYFERGGKRLRVAILDASLENGVLKITRVRPEGKGEMSYDAFLRSGARPL